MDDIHPTGTPAPGAETVDAYGLGEWRAAISTAFAPLHVRSGRRDEFRGRIRTRTVGEVAVSEVASGQQVVQRTSTLIDASGTGRYMLCLQLSGAGILIQDGREAILQPGDISIYDLDRPCTLVFEEDFRSLAVTVPYDRLTLPQPLVSQLTATRMPRDEGASRVVSPFLVELSRNIDALSGPEGRRLVASAVDLVATVFLGRLEVTRQDRPEDRRRALLRRLLDHVDANLADPDLGPATIAAAHFISTRHLHMVFREQGVSVSEWVRSRRLERCRRDLVDPAFRNETVAAVAARSGFVSASHFSQVFRKAFGESASDFRRRNAVGG